MTTKYFRFSTLKAVFLIFLLSIDPLIGLVGTLPGNFSVGNRGEGSYQIALKLPPGRQGIEPHLTLSYKNGRGNGPLGVGCGLSTGFYSAITRGRSILARDGVVRGINFDANDKFYLDGQRLLCVSGTYGAPGSSYRKEVDSFTTISTAGTGSNIETFVVTEKDGTKLTFGKYSGTVDAYQPGVISSLGTTPVVLDTLAYTYALKRVEDTLGNYVSFSYSNPAGGEFELSRIDYTGGPSVASAQSVLFSYAVRSDAPRTYVAGRYFEHTQLLQTITAQTLIGGTPTTSAIYTLNYENGPNSGRSRIHSISSQLATGQAPYTLQSLPATVLNWSNDAKSFVQSSTAFSMPAFTALDPGVPPSGTSQGVDGQSFGDYYSTGDFNNDGKDDYVTYSSNGFSVSLSTGSSWAAPVVWMSNTSILAAIGSVVNRTASPLHFIVCDINGDGRKDLIFYDGSLTGIYAVVSTGHSFVGLDGGSAPTKIGDMTTFFNDPAGSGTNGNCLLYEGKGAASRIAVGDFTGDGRDDVAVTSFDGKVYLFESTGTGFVNRGAVSDVGPAKDTTTALYNWNWTVRGVDVTVPASVEVIPIDINGDGRMDMVTKVVQRIYSPGSGSPSYEVYGFVINYYARLSKSDGTFSTSVGFASPGVYVQATGSSPLTVTRDQMSQGAIIGDFNGDGLPDFLVLFSTAAGSHWNLELYNGTDSSGNPKFTEYQKVIPGQVSNGSETDLTYVPVYTNTQWQSNGFGDARQVLGFPPYSSHAPGDRDVAFHSFESGHLVDTFAIDVNGDGIADLVWYVGSTATDGSSSNTGWWAMLSTGNINPGSDTTWGSGFTGPVKVNFLNGVSPGNINSTLSGIPYTNVNLSLGGDIDGDGHSDLFCENRYCNQSPYLNGGPPGMSISIPSWGFTALARNGDGVTSQPFGDTVSSIVDGVGRTTSVTYKAVKDQSIYIPGVAVSYPIRELLGSNPVVSDLMQDSGGSTADHFVYSYSGNYIDLGGRGELGFHSFVTIDSQTNVLKYQFLTQSFPMTGLAAREQTYRYWYDGTNSNFRLITSHDNTVVFDKVVDTLGNAFGSVYPFISKARESRWEDGTAAHYAFANPGSHSEDLYKNYFTSPPASPYIVINAQSLFDSQSSIQTTIPTTGVVFNPSDTDSSGANTPAGISGASSASAVFASLPGKIVNGNLVQLSTDYGDGSTSTVVNTYKVPVNGLTGLLDTVTDTEKSNYSTDSAPQISYNYFNNGGVATPLVYTITSTPPEGTLKLVTTYQRDTLGRIFESDIADTNAAGSPRFIGNYATSKNSTFNSVFDLPTATLDAYGHETDTVYDPFWGLPTLVTDPNHDARAVTYDPLGRPIKVVDQLTNLETDTSYAWTVVGASDWTLQQTVSPPSNAPTGISGISAYAVNVNATVKPPITSYYDRLGRLIRVSKQAYDGSQTLADTVYDQIGRVVAVSLPYKSGTTAYWTTKTYDPLGRISTLSAPNGTVTRYVYNGRVTQITATPATGTAQTNTTYVDAQGHTIEVWNADNSPSNIDPKSGSATAGSITFKLDGFGRMRETDLLGQTAPVTATYDGLGHQISLNDPDKGNWTYVNNALGEVVTQTDAKTNVTQSTFDNLRRPLTRITTETSGAVETANWYYYDTADNATLHQVAKGTQGWLLSPQREDSTTTGAPGYGAPTTTHIHYYDAYGRPFIDVSSVDGKWFYTYNGYDTYSRIYEIHHYWRPGTHEAATDQPYAWMDFGYTYNYDGNSYLTKLTDSASRVWWQADSTLGYDYLDRPVKVQKGSGHWTTRTYSPTDGTLTAISTSSVQNLSFGYDGFGNLKSRGDAIANVNETFNYDVLNRLVTATNTATSVVTSTSYLQNGNIQSKTDVNGNASGIYTYDPNHLHAVATAFGYTMAYDANGNLLTRTGNGHAWNTRWAGFDKPRWLAMDSSGNEFSYNVNRSRVLNLEFDAFSTAPTHYNRKRIYALGDTMEIDYLNSAPSGQSWKMDKVRIYVPGPEGTIGSMEFLASSLPAQSSGISLTDAQRSEVYHYDQLGSITAITEFGDTSTNIALDNVGRSSLYGYSPWGERRSPSSGSGSPTATTHGGHDDLTPRGFTCHEMLDTIGLVHMNGRIYDPVIGRMLSADIVVQAPSSLQSYNRYSYVMNNPLSLTDPTGFTWGDLQKGFDDLTKIVGEIFASDQVKQSGGSQSQTFVHDDFGVKASVANAAQGSMKILATSADAMHSLVTATPVVSWPVLTYEAATGKNALDVTGTLTVDQKSAQIQLGASLAVGLAAERLAPALNKLGTKILNSLSPEIRGAAESITNTKVLQFADGAWFEDVAAYRALKADISKNGLTNKLIEYTEIDGSKYVLRGNGRLQVAEDLKITDRLQFKKVDLPFQGYRTSADVLEEANRIIYNTPRGPQ